MIVGAFQERYPHGVSFGHAAAMIRSESESASEKKKTLAQCGVLVADTLESAGLLGLVPIAASEASRPRERNGDGLR